MGKLYNEMTAADWLRAKKLSPSEVPRTLVMVGEDWDPVERLSDLTAMLDVVVARPRWNVVIGDVAGRRIGLSNVCWGPMAAMVAHQFFAMGTEEVVLVGYFGGLDHGLRYGGALIVEAAEGEDGASAAYSGTGAHAADPGLVSRAAKLCDHRNLSHTRGRVVTTDAMLLEDQDTIARWVAAGYQGVDGETASVYAVAKRLGRRAVALLTCSDLLVAGHNLYEIDSAHETAADDALDTLVEIALDLAVDR